MLKKCFLYLAVFSLLFCIEQSNLSAQDDVEELTDEIEIDTNEVDMLDESEKLDEVDELDEQEKEVEAQDEKLLDGDAAEKLTDSVAEESC